MVAAASGLLVRIALLMLLITLLLIQMVAWSWQEEIIEYLSGTSAWMCVSSESACTYIQAEII